MSDTTLLPHERLPELFAWISEQQAAGRSDEDIAAELQGIDAMFLEQAVQDAIAAGQDEAEVRAFFAQMSEYGDAEPGDAIDEGDAGYTPDHGVG